MRHYVQGGSFVSQLLLASMRHEVQAVSNEGEEVSTSSACTCDLLPDLRRVIQGDKDDDSRLTRSPDEGNIMSLATNRGSEARQTGRGRR